MNDQDRQELGLLASHKASALAEAGLTGLGEPRNPEVPALLDFLIAWLEQQPKLGKNNFRAEMLEYAQNRLTKMSPFLAASYLVTDPESLDREIRDQPGQAVWPILEKHLTSLLNLPRKAPAAEAPAAGEGEALARVLEENFYEALRYQHPNFGRQPPS